MSFLISVFTRTLVWLCLLTTAIQNRRRSAPLPNRNYQVIDSISEPFFIENAPKGLEFNAGKFASKGLFTLTTYLKLFGKVKRQKLLEVTAYKDSLFNFDNSSWKHKDMSTFLYRDNDAPKVTYLLGDELIRVVVKSGNKVIHSGHLKLGKKKEWRLLTLTVDFLRGECSVELRDVSSEKVPKKTKISFPSYRRLNHRLFKLTFGENKVRERRIVRLKGLVLYNFKFKDTSLLKWTNFAINQPNQNPDFLFQADNKHCLMDISKTYKTVCLTDEFDQRENGMLFAQRYSINLGKFLPSKNTSPIKMMNFMLRFTVLDKIIGRTLVFKSELDTDETQSRRHGSNQFKLCLEQLTDGFRMVVEIETREGLKAIKMNGKMNAFIQQTVIISIANLSKESSQLLIYESAVNYKVSSVLNGNFDMSGLNYVLTNFNSSGTNLFVPPSLTESEAKTPVIILNRFTNLQSVNGAIFTIYGSKKKDKCSLPASPFGEDSRCKLCVDSVLLPKDNVCLEFCPPGTRSFNGVCISCKFNRCEEISSPTLKIRRVSNDHVSVQLTDRIPNIDLTTIADSLSVRIETSDPNGHKPTFKVIPVNDTTVQVAFEKGEEATGLTLKASLNTTKTAFYFDENRNLIYNFTKSFKLGAIRSLSSSKQTLQNLMSITYSIIYHFIILIGVFLFIFSFKNNIHDVTVKRLLNTFVFLQVFPLLLFLDTPLPPFLHSFLVSSYERINHFSFRQQSRHYGGQGINLSNFDEQSFSVSFLDNFGVSLSFQFGIFGLYITALFLNTTKHYFPVKIKSKISCFKRLFEFNVIGIVLFWFAQKGISLGAMQLKHSGDRAQTEVNLNDLIATFYVLCVVSLFSCFVFIFATNDCFTVSNGFKFKLSFFFIGYKNTVFGNIAEILIVSLKICFGYFMGFFLTDFSTQICGLFVVSLASFAIVVGAGSATRCWPARFSDVFLEGLMAVTIGVMLFDHWQERMIVYKTDTAFTMVIMTCLVLKFVIDIVLLGKYIVKSLKSTKIIVPREGMSPTDRQSFNNVHQEVVLNVSSQESDDGNEDGRTFGMLGSLKNSDRSIPYLSQKIDEKAINLEISEAPIDSERGVNSSPVNLRTVIGPQRKDGEITDFGVSEFNFKKAVSSNPKLTSSGKLPLSRVNPSPKSSVPNSPAKSQSRYKPINESIIKKNGLTVSNIVRANVETNSARKMEKKSNLNDSMRSRPTSKTNSVKRN